MVMRRQDRVNEGSKAREFCRPWGQPTHFASFLNGLVNCSNSMIARISFPVALSVIAGLLMSVASVDLHAADGEQEGQRMITDFTSKTPDLGWYTQNDNVMGGRSQGGFELARGQLIFAGNTNTDGGGFSSIRTRPMQVDLSGFNGIRLRVKGDGRRYTWQLQTDARWRGRQISYWADFDTIAGEWITVDIPFAKFYPQFRGFKLDGPPLDPAKTSEMGLYIYDKKDGPFELHLDSVNVY